MPIPATAGDLARQAAAAVDAEAAVRLAQQLVRIDSVYRPAAGGSEAACAAWLAERLRELGLRVIVEEAAPGRPNVVADLEGSGPGRTLLFEGHTDVVTEGDRRAWTRDPFGGEIADGRLYGRGACDMKGGIAAAVAAVEALRRAAPALPGRIRLAFVADEEGLMLGIKHFIRAGWAEGVDGAIVCEPEENELCLVQKGALRVVVTFTGRMAHGAMPYAGINPIPAAAAFVSRVHALDAATREQLGAHPLLGRPHITPTILQAPSEGEPQHNVVPAGARVALDIRTVPGQDHRALEARLAALLAESLGPFPGVTGEIVLVEDRPWTETPREAAVVRAVEAAHRLVLGDAPRYGGVPGTTDGTFLRAWAGVPIVTMGPGVRTVPHQADEWVGVADLATAARLYAAAAVLFLAGGG